MLEDVDSLFYFKMFFYLLQITSYTLLYLILHSNLLFNLPSLIVLLLCFLCYFPFPGIFDLVISYFWLILYWKKAGVI